MLNENTVNVMANPGHTESIGCLSMCWVVLVLSMDPHDGKGGGTP